MGMKISIIELRLTHNPMALVMHSELLTFAPKNRALSWRHEFWSSLLSMDLFKHARVISVRYILHTVAMEV